MAWQIELQTVAKPDSIATGRVSWPSGPKKIPGEDDRRHMIELAAIYERTADNLAPATSAASEASIVFFFFLGAWGKIGVNIFCGRFERRLRHAAAG